MTTDEMRSLARMGDRFLWFLPMRKSVERYVQRTALALLDAANEVDRLRGELNDAEEATIGDWQVCREALAQRDRMRAVIENAPHGHTCASINSMHVLLPDRSCTCWKADAL